jgi:plasmid stability protein
VATLNIKDFPEALHRRLKALARRRHRSLAQEVTALLDEAVSRGDARSLQELRGLGRQIWEGRDAAKYVAAERDAWD